MLSTIIIWGYLFLLALIYGISLIYLIPPLKASPNTHKNSAFIIILIGLAAITSTAGLLSLWMNIGLAANLVILIIGIGACIWRRTNLWGFLLEKIQALKRLNRLTVLTFLAIFLVILLKSTQPVQNYDTGLYHAQAIRWMETYPAIPGLGNLSDRLVFNSSWLLLSSLFSFSFTGLRSFHVLNGMLAVILCGYTLGKFDRLLKGEITLSNITAVFLPFLLRRIFSLEFSSPGTDLPAALIVWIILTVGLEKADQNTASCFDFNFLAIFTLSVFALTIKLSTLPILLLPLYFFLRQAGGVRRSSLGASIALTALLCLPWMGRSLIQSGYLVYPLPQVNMIHPDWQIPEENARGTVRWIHSWAKIATSDREAVEQMAPGTWMPIWFNSMVPLDRQIILLNGLALALLVFLFAFWLRRERLIRALLSPYPVIYLAVLIGIAYWFFQAPAMRFGYSFLAFFPVICLAPFLMGAMRRYSRLGRWAAYSILILLVLYQGVSVYRLANLETLREIALLPADYPKVPVGAHSLGSITVYTPLEGDQCWYAPFPCVPAIDTNIRMRGNTLMQGFRAGP